VRQLLLVRHCESSGQAADAPLTARGREQAETLAERLASHPIDHVVSSPYLRARQTIEPFAARAGHHLHVHADLAERRLSPVPIEGWREVVRRSFSDPEHRAPAGESGAETLARGWAALDAILRGGHRLPVVVSHGQLLSLLLHSIDPSFGFAGWESMRNPDVFLVRGAGRGSFRFERIWDAG
jgi:2,3-bisphosphoglycerate-dependent phosphoglycerate mutase